MEASWEVLMGKKTVIKQVKANKPSALKKGKVKASY